MRPSSMCVRGWNWFGPQQIDVDLERALGGGRRRARRIGNERAQAAAEGGTFVSHAVAPCVGAGRGIARASSFAREREVGFGAARFHVVEDRGHAVARRFAEPDVARDDGVVDALLEERADVAGDLLAEVGALVVHRQQHAGDVERRVERGADAAQRRDEIGEPFEREVLAVERNEHGVGGDERVEREQPERRRRVDEDVVEAIAERVQDGAGGARDGAA